MQCEGHSKREVHLDYVDLLCMSDKKESADDNVFNNTIPVKMTEEGDENSAMGL